ncbi:MULTISPECIES: DUF3791 domain-containing protein [unclassified Treponema]|uniref:DUF3791 domain-containing protein n=1 Tax=unclassified Treponema TaxID=2638727 RepID=UPI0020A47BB9|nr:MULTISPECIES: DUF3791 domain-containing protein [unclassified Treponema]UTC67411.1 DUF3791 domain-containing protein [Treponema sp. OMZ 789]UTC70139.1 DUF3791 domain-containing protein [Treponema sp. OMZ 790]UTC72854.1 DUF3791 domain-containing protein [Treponema sp. OMZ 791]
MTANPILLQKKYARIVALYAERTGLSLSSSLKKFYHSIVYKLMSQGISDMHCMSDDYLVEELLSE